MRKQQGDCFTWQGVLALSCLLKRAAWYLRSKYHEQPPGCECCCLTYNPHSLSIPPHSVAASGFCFFDVSSRSFDLASDVSILSFLIWLKICFQYSVFKVQSDWTFYQPSETKSFFDLWSLVKTSVYKHISVICKALAATCSPMPSPA